MAGIRKATRGLRVWKKLTWRGRKHQVRRAAGKALRALSPGTARTGRRIATRRRRQRAALRRIRR